MTMHQQVGARQVTCPIRDVLDRLGDRWTVLVLSELAGGTRRFSVLRREIADVSPRMLAQTLRHLEQDGLVTREVFAVIPPRVDYSLTSLGRSFFERVEQMIRWADDNAEQVHAARRRYVAPVAQPAK